MERCKFLTVLMVLSLLTRVFAFCGGDGSESNPYQISTKADLEAVNNDLQAHYILLNDIDLAGHVYYAAIIAPHSGVYVDFVDEKFTGDFDGAGFSVRNLIIAENDLVNHDTFKALFGYVCGGKISNLGIESANVSGEGDLAGLVGFSESAELKNCYSICNVNGSGSTAGGLIGYARDGSIISGCYATGAVNATSYVGGLVGGQGSPGVIENCYANCDVAGSSDYVGGLVGYNYFSSIINCYSNSIVTGGSDFVGGLVGIDYYGTVINCFWDIETSGITSSDRGEPKTFDQMQMAATFIGWNDGSWTINEGNDYPRLNWEKRQGITIETSYPVATYTGLGTELHPFQLSNEDDILSFSKRSCDWDKYFKLINNIDMQGVVYIPPSNFKGGINGNGYGVYNLIIDSETVGENLLLGFIGHLSEGGYIKNLGLEDALLSGESYVGGLVGKNEGCIENCYVIGDITGSENFTGGLIGHNSSNILNSYAAVNISGCRDAGGLVGLNYRGSSIANCYSTGSVSGTWSSIGGLAGYNYHGNIINSYAVAHVSGKYNFAGLVGYNYSGSISNCFWDVEFSDLNIGYNQSSSDPGIITNVLGLTTVQMKTQSTFTSAGWDTIYNNNDGLLDIWYNIDGELPRLFWQWQPKGDINYDSSIDTADLAVMMSEWLASEQIGKRLLADVNLDGSITLEDFALFAFRF
ncbi:MAG: GLUG motif-containing protein [Sedimentisphaeraceae bacterium JB056]